MDPSSPSLIEPPPLSPPRQGGLGLPRWLTGLLAAAVWAIALRSVLEVHRSDAIGEWLGHGVCGPWGCAATPQALLGYHAFWLTLVAPPCLALGWSLPPRLGRAAGWSLLILGLLLTAGVVGWAVFDCLALGPEHLRQYWVQVGVFQLVTKTDLPCAQIAAAGVACLAAAALRQRLGRSASARSASAQSASAQSAGEAPSMTPRAPRDPATPAHAAAAESPGTP